MHFVFLVVVLLCFLNIFIFMCISALPGYIYMCVPHSYHGAQGGQKRVLGTLELEFQKDVSFRVSAGN